MRVSKLAIPDITSILKLNLYLTPVSAGFPSPADDYVERTLDLNKHLIKHPAATIFAKAHGSSLKGRGIFSGDILIVDRSLETKHGSIVVAALDGELTCKIYDHHLKALVSANKRYPPIPLGEDRNAIFEGVVTHSIRSHLL